MHLGCKIRVSHWSQIGYPCAGHADAMAYVERKQSFYWRLPLRLAYVSPAERRQLNTVDSFGHILPIIKAFISIAIASY